MGGHEALHQLTHCEHERLEIEPHRDHHAEEDPADEAAALQADPHQLILLCAVRLRTIKSRPMTMTPKRWAHESVEAACTADSVGVKRSR